MPPHSNSSVRRSRSGIFCLVLLGLLVVSACSERERATDPDPDGPSDPGSDGPHDTPGAVTDTILAAVGGVIETPGGIRVTIEPEDLGSDTPVTVVPVDFNDSDGRHIVGARFEPEGLALDRPIVVSFPLPPDWQAEDDPIVLEFWGDNPEDAVHSYNYARLVGSPGNYRAEVLVSHFSGVVCASNCHAGTIRYVLEQFEAAGCSAADALAKVREQFPGVEVPDNGCGGRGVETVQAFLDTFFDDLGGYDTGVSIPGSVIDNVIEIAESGRQVVIAYRPDSWEPRGGENNFYPTGAMSYAHTTALEKRDGVWQLRNSLATSSQKLVDALGGNTVWYPVQDINTFRTLQQGVATELQYCGAPDCLAFPDRNPDGLEVYGPVDGLGFSDDVWTNSWDYVLTLGQWNGIPPRGAAWTAARIYVQKPGATLDPCDDEDEIAIVPSLPGYSGPYVVGAIQSDYATWNGDPGHPGLITVTDPDVSPLDTDRFAITFRKTIPGPGTYNITGSLADTDVQISFFTQQILNEDFPSAVTFVSQSGTVTLESFGVAEGSRIVGTFNATLYGEKITVRGEDRIPIPIEGSISGSFDVIF